MFLWKMNEMYGNPKIFTVNPLIYIFDTGVMFVCLPAFMSYLKVSSLCNFLLTKISTNGSKFA